MDKNKEYIAFLTRMQKPDENGEIMKSKICNREQRHFRRNILSKSSAFDSTLDKAINVIEKERLYRVKEQLIKSGINIDY